MLLSCYMTSFVLDPFMSFSMSYDLVTIIVIYDITLISNLMFQNKNKIKENRNMKGIENN